MSDIAIVVGGGSGSLDAIREHADQMAAALTRIGRGAEVVEVGRGRSTDLGGCCAVIVQYNPFQYARWGFAPWLPRWFSELRRQRSRPALALMVHEPYVPIINPKTALMGAWQRAQLFSLYATADIVLASIEAWTRMMQSWRPTRPVYHLPIGSNLPDYRGARRDSRARLGIEDEAIVLASLMTAHPSRLLSWISASANAVVEHHQHTILLHLGAGAPALSGLGGNVRLYEPGVLTRADLAAMLAAADIYLAPFVDGVSTRRTSFMAALQHGVPVIAGDGPLTDSILRESPALRLVSVDDPRQFVDTVVRLADDKSARRRLGSRGRALYEMRFDWPVLARRLDAIIRAHADSVAR